MHPLAFSRVSDPSAAIEVRTTCPQQPIPMDGLPVEAFDATERSLLSEDDEAGDWSEEDVVYLHWRMLEELRRLQDPETPLALKIELLSWIFAEGKRTEQPFSFERCVRTVSLSPHSPTPFFGDVDMEEIRDWISTRARKWLEASLQRYPVWARELVYEYPGYVAERLSANPQWLNEQVSRQIHSKPQGDLFT